MKQIMRRILAPLGLMAGLAALPAAAGDLVFGVGLEDSLNGADRSDVTGTLEWHAAPSWRPGGAEVGFAVAGRTDDGGDLWAGAGLSALVALGPRWLLEGSVMPGAYVENGDDLGSGFEVRSLLGLGYRVAPETVLGVGVSHISNAGLASRNPGVEAVSLRLRRAF